MVVDHLLKKIQQAHSLAELDHLLNKETLTGNLAGWLLKCIDGHFSERTLEAYEKRTLDFIKSVGENIKPQAVTRSMISFYLIQREKGGNRKRPVILPDGKIKPLSPVSMLDIFRTLHTFFEYMCDKEVGVIEHSPMEGMKPPKQPEQLIMPYTEEEAKRFIKVCDFNKRFTSIRNKAMFLLYMSSGLRKLEMTGLMLEHVDVVRQQIKVIHGKGDKQRVVGFGKAAKKALMEYFTERQKRVKPGFMNLWLSEEGKPLGYAGIGLAISDYNKLAGIKISHSTHALRHTFATEAIRNGAQLSYVQALMGHKDPSMTQKYQKTVDSQDAVKRHNTFAPDDNWFNNK